MGRSPIGTRAKWLHLQFIGAISETGGMALACDLTAPKRRVISISCIGLSVLIAKTLDLGRGAVVPSVSGMFLVQGGPNACVAAIYQIKPVFKKKTGAVAVFEPISSPAAEPLVGVVIF